MTGGMGREPQLAVVLAAMQAADLVVTSTSPKYGDHHLEQLGVPRWIRPWLPAIKTAAVVALVGTRNQRSLRRATGAALVAYYSAAATFHLRSGGTAADAAPAIAYGAVAVTLVR